MTNTDQTELAHFSAMAQTWWDPEGSMKPLHQLNPLRVQFITEHSPTLKGCLALDVGCGGGILTESLAALGCRTLGIDAAEPPLQVARQHAKQSGLSIEYLHKTVENLATTHLEQFDIITCLELLEHVPDPASVVTACSKLLKPGGILFFSTINRTPKAFVLTIVGAEYLLRMLPKGTHHYEKFIRPSELDAWARPANLTLSAMTGLTYHPFSKDFSLNTRDVSVNYLVAYRKP